MVFNLFVFFLPFWLLIDNPLEIINILASKGCLVTEETIKFAEQYKLNSETIKRIQWLANEKAKTEQYISNVTNTSNAPKSLPNQKLGSEPSVQFNAAAQKRNTRGLVSYRLALRMREAYGTQGKEATSNPAKDATSEVVDLRSSSENLSLSDDSIYQYEANQAESSQDWNLNQQHIGQEKDEIVNQQPKGQEKDEKVENHAAEHYNKQNLSEHETKNDKNLSEHKTKKEKKLSEYETKNDKKLSEHEVKKEKKMYEHKTKKDKKLSEHETKKDQKLSDHKNIVDQVEPVDSIGRDWKGVLLDSQTIAKDYQKELFRVQKQKEPTKSQSYQNLTSPKTGNLQHEIYRLQIENGEVKAEVEKLKNKLKVVTQHSKYLTKTRVSFKIFKEIIVNHYGNMDKDLKKEMEFWITKLDESINPDKSNDR